MKMLWSPPRIDAACAAWLYDGTCLARGKPRSIGLPETLRASRERLITLLDEDTSGELSLAAIHMGNSARRSSPLQQTETLPASVLCFARQPAYSMMAIGSQGMFRT